MNEEAMCCESCFKIIAKNSTIAAQIWITLCDLQFNHKVFGLMVEDTEHIKLLESLRFITTTDTNSVTIFKVHGLQEDEDGKYFCTGECGE